MLSTETPDVVIGDEHRATSTRRRAPGDEHQAAAASTWHGWERALGMWNGWPEPGDDDYEPRVESFLATVGEIRGAGCAWPLASPEARAEVVECGVRIDLAATLVSLRRAEEEWRQQRVQAGQRFHSFRGARSVDEVTDAETYARRCAEGASRVAGMLSTLRKKRAAAEPGQDAAAEKKAKRKKRKRKKRRR